MMITWNNLYHLAREGKEVEVSESCQKIYDRM